MANIILASSYKALMNAGYNPVRKLFSAKTLPCGDVIRRFVDNVFCLHSLALNAFRQGTDISFVTYARVQRNWSNLFKQSPISYLVQR